MPIPFVNFETKVYPKWRIQSFTNPLNAYEIIKMGDEYYCNCPSFLKGRNRPCKHIEYLLEAMNKIQRIKGGDNI